MSTEELKRLAVENREMDAAILSNFRIWALVENAFPMLLIQVLQLKAMMHSYAFVIYFSSTSLGARITLVDNMVVHFNEAFQWSDKSVGERFYKAWGKVKDLLDKATMIRNIVAHGTPHTVPMKGKNHVRLTSPLFDILRVGGKIVKGKLPGLGLSDLQESNSRLLIAHDGIHLSSHFIAAVLGVQPQPWQEKLLELEACLTKIANPK